MASPDSSSALRRLENEDMSSYKTRLVVQHILSRIAGITEKAKAAPLIVGLQGPQGSGKTTLTTSLKQVLSGSPHNLNVAIYSLDDLYLPHTSLEAIKISNPTNKLLHGRGQPGTHDLDLGTEILRELSRINDEPSLNANEREVHIPVYDKSAFGGQGDRSEKTVQIKVPPKLDLVIFEGWCLGFKSLDQAKLEEVYNAHRSKAENVATDQGKQKVWSPYYLNHSLENLKEINGHLNDFERHWYPFLKDFIQLLPEPETDEEKSSDPFGCETIFKWRLQAEEDMKSRNGGKGMNKLQVRSFVERYFPSYEMFSSTLTELGKDQKPGSDSASISGWKPSGLRIELGSEREVKRVENF